MANLKDNNYHNLKIRVNKDEYWDFFINKDSFGRFNSDPNSMYDKCLISYIDASLPECVSGDTWLFGVNKYQWESAYTINNTLYNIGYTGVDNGLIRFRKDRVSNKEFFDIYTKSKYDIEEGDNRLKLHAVSGSTLLYDYPLHVENGYVKFNGGFYQGFFKTECDKYYILPSSMDTFDTWEFEFVLNKCELEKESNKTLNDKYPNNKGIFFYMGTRAENKWIYMYNDEYNYNGHSDDCFALSYDDYIEGGEIDKKTYLIGNFFDVEPEYYDDDIDDYLNFNYYDDSYYTTSEAALMSGYSDCDGESIMDDYLDYDIKPKIIDETLPHETMTSWCCCNGKSCGKSQTVQVAFFNACGCLNFKNVRKQNALNNDINCYDIFGEDDYIDDFDGLEADDGYFENELDITDFEYETNNGFKFSSAGDYYFYTDNKFMMFDRTPKGYTVRDWVEGTQMMYFGKKNKFKGNLFILMNRTATGYTVNDIDKLRDEANNYYGNSLYSDIYNNAFALRITDEGEIGYRYLVLDCDSEREEKFTIEEGYSFPNVISDCEWHTVHVKIKEMIGTIKLYFYVDGKLVYVTKSLPKFNFHALNEMYEKQESVPFNISLGGGTQGLAETVLPNYMLEPTRVYPLEENFAGTFIGYIKSFKFYNCGMEHMNILNNYKYESKNI